MGDIVSAKDASMTQGFYDDNTTGYDSDELDYSGGQRTRHRVFKPSKYSLHVEYPSQPGYGANRGPKAGLISRNPEGKFVLDEDEGGFEIKLPPNRFRTRSVAIVAGYSPERLYSNMPSGAFVVESGMYKVGADRGGWERPEPVYWKQVSFSVLCFLRGTCSLSLLSSLQVVYGARNHSEGSGTLPRPSQYVGQLGAEDIRRLRELDPTYANNFASENISAISPNFQFDNQNMTQSQLARTSNLELVRGKTLRASSPLNQEQPLIEWAANNFSEISSVPHPSSLEPSLPSTLLTDSSRKVTTTLSSELETIPENSRVVADIHGTYRNADSMFPNYALNYPTPVHGNLSPSRQYPPQPPPGQRFGFEDYQPLDPYYPYVPPQSQFYTTSQFAQPQQPPPQNPLATSSPPTPRRHVYYNHGYLSDHDYENMKVQRPSYQQRPRSEPKRRKHGRVMDAVSLVSEDAEVTAITHSSSPGSSVEGVPSKPLPYYENLQYVPPLLPHAAEPSPALLDSSSEKANKSQPSRPGSAHSAPMLDLSIDRHYEFDSARTPTDDLQPPALPRNWNRPYLGYNPRTRDRELGELARSEQRVFSDSEIYSPVFPRGRPEPRVDVSARVEAMRKEFAEYQRQMTPLRKKPSATTPESPSKKQILSDDDKLESLIWKKNYSDNNNKWKRLREKTQNKQNNSKKSFLFSDTRICVWLFTTMT